MNKLNVVLPAAIAAAFVAGCASDGRSSVKMAGGLEFQPVQRTTGAASPDAWYSRGRYFQGQNRLDEAEKSFRTVVELQPAHAEAHNALGAVLAGRGQLAAAESEFRAALRTAPDQAHIRGNLGRVLMLQGRYDEARIALEDAALIDPGNRSVRINLAELATKPRQPAAAPVIATENPPVAPAAAVAAVTPVAGQPTLADKALPRVEPVAASSSGTSSAPTTVHRVPADSVVVVSAVPLGDPRSPLRKLEPISAVTSPAVVTLSYQEVSGVAPLAALPPSAQERRRGTTGAVAEPPAVIVEPVAASAPVAASEAPIAVIEAPVVAATPADTVASAPVLAAETPPAVAESPLKITEPSLAITEPPRAAEAAPVAPATPVAVAEVPVIAAEPPVLVAEMPVPASEPPLAAVASQPDAAQAPVAAAGATVALAELPAVLAEPPQAVVEPVSPVQIAAAEEPQQPEVQPAALRSEPQAAPVESGQPATAPAEPPSVDEARAEHLARQPDGGAAVPPLRPRLEVSNGNGVEGMARRIKKTLLADGYARVRATNQLPYRQKVTSIQYRVGFEQQARALGGRFPQQAGVVYQARLDARADVRIVLGRDLPRAFALNEEGKGDTVLLASAVKASD